MIKKLKNKLTKHLITYKYLLVFLVVLVLFFTVSQGVLATELKYPTIPGFGNTVTDASKIGDLIAYLFSFAVISAGVLGVLSIVIAGISLLVSVGNPSAMSDAKDRIFSAVLGIVLLMCSFILLQTINPQLTGFTRFNLKYSEGVYRLDPKSGAPFSPPPPSSYHNPNPLGASVAMAASPSSPSLDDLYEVYPAEKSVDNLEVPPGSLLWRNCRAPVAGKPPLLVWLYRVIDEDDSDPQADTISIPCIETADDLSNLAQTSVSLDNVESYRYSQENGIEPGVYLFEEEGCIPSTQNVASGPIRTSGPIDPDFVGNIKSALIVNGGGLNDPRYGFVLTGPNGASSCSEPYVNFATSTSPDDNAYFEECINIVNDASCPVSPPPATSCNSQGQCVEGGGGASCTSDSECTTDPVNAELGVIKVIDNTGGGTAVFSDFSFQISGGPTQVNQGNPIAFESDGNNGFSLDPGTYTVTEVSNPDYNTSYSADCTNVILASGDNKFCTITNTYESASTIYPLVINKVCNPVDDQGVFSIVVNNRYYIPDVECGDQHVVYLDSTIDTGINVYETLPSNNYTATFAGQCQEPSVTFAPGASYECTVTNTNTTTPGFTLAVSKSGSGNGTVTSSPAGINCDINNADCSETYNSATLVTLTAAPASGSTFGGWSGSCTGSATTCTVNVDRYRSVTAAFNSSSVTYNLSVTKSGAGTGTVTGPIGIEDGINCGTNCNELYNNGTSVTLTATAAAGSAFVGWGGACTGTGSCTVTINGAKTVNASFNLSSSGNRVLTVTKSGNGSGTVTSSPAGINCGTTCSANYTNGTSVTLTAAPASGSTFAGWGGACTGTGACTVTMDASKTVTAQFNTQTQAFNLSVGTAGNGAGTVNSSPTGISNCRGFGNGDCSESYTSGTSVTLTAAADANSVFVGWEGSGINCPGTGTCTVVMDAAKNATARFNVASSPICSPGFQTIPGGSYASFTASGGNGQPYFWSAPGADFTSAPTGSSFQAGYYNQGFYTVSVTDGSSTDFCTVEVNSSFQFNYPQLTLNKIVINTGGGTASETDWTLTAAGPDTISGTDNSPSITNRSVSPGTYNLSENGGPTDYTASSWSCSKDGGVTTTNGNSITLGAGENATCTITNTYDDSSGQGPTVTITANPNSITSGQSSTLSWTSTNTTSCTASGNWTGAKSTSGSEIVSPTTTSFYTLTCSGPGGSASHSATVTVEDGNNLFFCNLQTQTCEPAENTEGGNRGPACGGPEDTLCQTNLPTYQPPHTNPFGWGSIYQHISSALQPKNLLSSLSGIVLAVAADPQGPDPDDTGNNNGTNNQNSSNNSNQNQTTETTGSTIQSCPSASSYIHIIEVYNNKGYDNREKQWTLYENGGLDEFGIRLQTGPKFLNIPKETIGDQLKIEGDLTDYFRANAIKQTGQANTIGKDTCADPAAEYPCINTVDAYGYTTIVYSINQGVPANTMCRILDDSFELYGLKNPVDGLGDGRKIYGTHILPSHSF